jgi:hypothetical protein
MMFGLGKYALYAIGAAVAVSLATGFYFHWRHEQRMVGWNNALAAVAAQNARAREAAEEVTGDVNQCFDAGGSWDVSTGKCNSASNSGVRGLFSN